jgi:hypothetical protein
MVLRIYLCLPFVCLCLGISAQNYISAAPWDNALSYNPSIVGLTTDESFQMNIFSQKSLPLDLPPGFVLNPLDFRNTIDFGVALPELVDIKNSYFLGYQKTIPFLERCKLTGGLQLQHSKRVRRVSQDATGIGFSINVHFIKKITPLITRNWSFGYQLNILFQTPNRGVTSYAYGLLSDPIISLDEYKAQFRNAGANQTVSLNYTYLIKKKTAINLGFVFSGNQYKIARASFPNLNGTVSFRSVPQGVFRLNVELQQSIGKNLMLQTNALFAQQSQLAYGFGFRIGKTNLLKFLVINYPVLMDIPLNTFYSAGNISLDMKRFKYTLTFGLENITFAKLGVVFRFAERDTKSLISIGN